MSLTHGAAGATVPRPVGEADRTTSPSGCDGDTRTPCEIGREHVCGKLATEGQRGTVTADTLGLDRSQHAGARLRPVCKGGSPRMNERRGERSQVMVVVRVAQARVPGCCAASRMSFQAVPVTGRAKRAERDIRR